MTTFPLRRWLDSKAAHVGAVEPDALRTALAASVLALMSAGAEARLPHADTVAQRLAELADEPLP